RSTSVGSSSAAGCASASSPHRGRKNTKAGVEFHTGLFRLSPLSRAAAAAASGRTSHLLDFADVHADVGHRIGTASGRALRTFGIAEHVPLTLRVAVAGADDVARVAIATAAARLPQDAERAARDALRI